MFIALISSLVFVVGRSLLTLAATTNVGFVTSVVSVISVVFVVVLPLSSATNVALGKDVIVSSHDFLFNKEGSCKCKDGIV